MGGTGENPAYVYCGIDIKGEKYKGKYDAKKASKSGHPNNTDDFVKMTYI